jgi:mono/diheme cytochrome c family protein
LTVVGYQFSAGLGTQELPGAGREPKTENRSRLITLVTVYFSRPRHQPPSKPTNQPMHRPVESRRTHRTALLTLSVVALASVLSTPPIVAAQSKTPAKKVAAKTSKSSAKPAAATTATTAASKLPDGKQVFSTTCAACHQVSGEGVPGVYPPLAGSEWVTGDEAKVVRILLHGVTGPIEVAGETFNGMMPPWGGTLKDDDIAAVLTYVRSTWGNKGAPITAAKVASIRAATTSRTTPWTSAELAQVK